MAPKLNISLYRPNLTLFKSFILKISGATKPGVPHRTKMYFGSFISVAKPKSTIFIDSKVSETMIFSGLMSLCTMLKLAMFLSPFKSAFRIIFLSLILISLCLFRQSYKLVPSTYSIERQIELSVSYTPYRDTRFVLCIVLIMLISFSIAFFPSPLQAASFMKAFMATYLWAFRSQAKYTEAKFPLPIFLTGLKNS